ncbi:hypothetical protein RDV77_03485 [Porphyromonadaceae sp. NP-X]|jgi:hypothetical protein|nr:hypothetical protein [Paludibacteraceae bacterium]MBP9016420.1 hypothetical protein [Paludibacteraceae bacterium]MDS1031687.1 hypothetical protein [Porphyromonadaceae sp. NP-X]NLJ20926.1 hypothetical protein [Bacteroidales bacterium]
MPTEDYLLKYLEKLSRVIAAMLGFRDSGFPEDALKMADGTYRELLNVDLKELTVEPTEKFSETIRKANYSASILDLLVQLTYETANAFEQNRQSAEAHSFYRKTLELYRLLNEKDKTFSFEREMRIGEINEKLL